MNAKAQTQNINGAVPSYQTEVKPQVPQVNTRAGIEGHRGYVRVSKGYPVEPGQTWHDLTPLQRGQWMRDHENRWKKKYNENKELQAAGGGMSWTRG